MRKFSRRVFVASVLALATLAPGKAQAQTAEETVLFMLFGYEKDTGDKLWPGVTFIAAKVTNCKYTVGIDAAQFKSMLTFDFEKMKQYLIEPGREPYTARVVAYGQKWIHARSADPKTGEVQDADVDTLDQAGLHFIVRASVDRLQKAVAYFQTQFCKPSMAF